MYFTGTEVKRELEGNLRPLQNTKGFVMMKLLGMSLVAGLTLVGAAQAADMPLKAPRVVAPEWNWTGFYVGGHLGAGWARKEWSDLDGFDLGSHNAIGVLGGFQAGFNYQVGRIVLGIEGQYSFADLKGDHENSYSFSAADTLFFHGFPIASRFFHADVHDRFSTKVENIATIAARIGLVSGPQDRTLWYVKGGAAYARDNFKVSETFSAVACADFLLLHACQAANGGFTASANQSRWGWMVGTGLEFGLFDNWSAKVEYNYLDLGNKTVNFTIADCREDCSFDTKVDQTIHVVKFGLNYRLWGGRY